MDFLEVPERISFPEQEEKVLQFWTEIDAFRTSLKLSEGRPRYSFYDGPPFATGLPHYGHILAGTIKDVVTRYWHQQGYYVERRFGWDCHGLPVEYEIDKKLNLRSREDVLKMGIDKYNAECRSIVMRYAGEWERTVSRMGRWIDFENDYKTLNTPFMESVWWVFGEMFKKGLVYRGYKVMPYSMACHTPLSNFEANQNYKETSDPAVIVSFPLTEDNNVSVLAWTTTPWTLPSNLALCVNGKMTYVKVRDIASGKMYILMERRLSSLYKSTVPGTEFDVLDTFLGEALVGKTYLPLFNYFYEAKKKDGFRIVMDDYVSDDSGTGVVHQAPAFGEDDYRVCMANGVLLKGEAPVLPLDEIGNFTSEVPDFAGRNVKEADKDIIKMLKANGRLVHAGTIVHSYPYCWRSDTPLIYRAIPSWFVKVEELVERLLANNAESRWVPEFVQTNRFANWLRDARDWSISRNRFWGTPIPLWVSDDGEEVVCISSLAELKEHTGADLSDIHREHVDPLTIPSRQGKGVLRRVDEVFDCWFESGSMPYAQVHYPFENADVFEKSFPADFIAEGLDQTRGWFYTLLVVSTALFDKPSYKNLIVNGLVLAADGKKMSKRLKNYPDPADVINGHSADALRLYLINSPVVRAEPLRFKEEGVRGIVKDIFLPWFNAYRFFVQNAQRLELENQVKFTYDPSQTISVDNVMDKWILAATHELIKFVMEEMAAYRLYTVVPRLVKLIDDLTNWYVRLNRRRLKGEAGVKSCLASLQTLYEVVQLLTRMMSPFTPFLTEYMFQNLRRALPPTDDDTRSVHFMPFPKPTQAYFDHDIVRAVGVMQRVIELGRVIRERKSVSLKTPVREVIVLSSDQQSLDDAQGLKGYILEELNARQLTCTMDRAAYGVQFKADPNFKVLGKRLGADLQSVSNAIRAMTVDEIVRYRETPSVVLLGHKLEGDDIVVVMKATGASSSSEARQLELNQFGNLLVLLDMTPDESLAEEGLAREVINRVQRLRKKAELKATDDVAVYYDITADVNGLVAGVLSTQGEAIAKACRGAPLPIASRTQADDKIILKEEQEIKGARFVLSLYRP